MDTHTSPSDSSFQGKWAPCLCCAYSVPRLLKKSDIHFGAQDERGPLLYTPWSSRVNSKNIDWDKRAQSLLASSTTSAKCPLCNFPIERYLDSDVCTVLATDRKAVITNHPQLVQHPAFDVYESPEAALAFLSSLHAAPEPLTRLVSLPLRQLTNPLQTLTHPHARRRRPPPWAEDPKAGLPSYDLPVAVTLDGLSMHSLLGLDQHLDHPHNDSSYLFLPVQEAYQIAPFPVLLASHLVHGWDVLDRWFHDHPRTKVHLVFDTSTHINFDELPADIALLTKKEENLPVLMHKPGHRQKLKSRRNDRIALRHRWYTEICHLPLAPDWRDFTEAVEVQTPRFSSTFQEKTFTALHAFCVASDIPFSHADLDPRLLLGWGLPVTSNTLQSSDLFTAVFRYDLPTAKDAELPPPERAHPVSNVIRQYFDNQREFADAILTHPLRRTLFRVLEVGSVRNLRHHPVFLQVVQNESIRLSALRWYARFLQLEARCLRFQKRVQSAPTCSQCTPPGDTHDDRSPDPVPAPDEHAEHAVR